MREWSWSLAHLLGQFREQTLEIRGTLHGRHEREPVARNDDEVRDAVQHDVRALGIDVVHYSTVVVAATGIGLFLPPIGVGFFIACGIANIPGDRATGAMMPYVYMMCVGLLIVILVPWVTLVVPRLLRLG